MSGKFDKLLNQFKSKKWDDRKEAYDIFKKKIDNKLATVLINELSKNTNEDFNYWILKLILHLKKLNVKNRKLLFAIIKNYSTTKNYKLLSYFIPLLVSFNDELSIIYLVELFKAPKWGIRNEVSENLIKIGGSVAPYLIKAFQNSSNPDVQYWAMKVYGKVMGSKSLEKLGNAYKSNNYLIRYYSIIALGESETTKAIPILVKSLDDNSFIIRTRSAEILERIGEKILPFLEVFFNKGTSNMKISTIKLFARIKGENGINDIVEMTKYLPDRSFYLISALAELKTFNSMNLLIELLLDPSWEVRKYTFDQLIKFGPYTIRFLKKYISDNKYIDTELLVWFSKIFSYFPVEASSEIVFLLKMKHEDVLNTFLENIRIDRITKDIVYELSSYFHHEKWPVRKKVALFLRKCGKLVIPFLKDYYSESVNADEKYWTARTLLYLGETTDLNVEGENDILLDELAQEVSKINEEIIKNIEPVPEKIIDKKEVIIEKISSLENMYLKNLLMGIVTEEDVRKQMNQVLMMKDYISKNDFSILLDLYDYVLEPGIKENLLEIMKPIFSQDYLDIFIYLFTAEENELLKIKILGFMKYSRTKAVFELATSLCDSKNEEIRSLALYIYKSH
ncbi:HEAT repeat domain-containing protein, partial [bacterium]|nr:HEAT repeat domain-containing protein [bacterium]